MENFILETLILTSITRLPNRYRFNRGTIFVLAPNLCHNSLS